MLARTCVVESMQPDPAPTLGAPFKAMEGMQPCELSLALQYSTGGAAQTDS